MHNAELPRPEADVQAPLDAQFDEEALFTLRSAVAAHAAELGAGTALADMILVAHELSSNAVRHGGGTGRLRLWRAGGHLYCEVTDTGPGLSDPESAGTRRPSPSVPGGRGLWIARYMAAVEIKTGPDGTTVTAAIQLPE
jgi:anti-sigma regulatory factor (Ser/Thr protein kinase)